MLWVLGGFSCVQLFDPMDCSTPGSSVHGISQARTLEWVATPPSRRSSWPRDRTHISYVSCIGMQGLYHFTETIKGGQVVHDMGSSPPPGPEWSRGDPLHTPEVQAGPRLRIRFTQSFISYKGWCTWYHSQFLTQTILGPSQSWTTASSVSFGLLFKKVEFRWNWFCVLIQSSGSPHLPHFTRQNFQIHPSDKSRSLWKPHFQLQTSRLAYCKILPLKFHTYVPAEKCLSFSWVLLSSIKFIYPHTTPSIVRGWEVYWGCMTVRRWWEQCPRQTGLQTLPFDSTAHKPAPQWEVAGSGQTCRYVCPWSDA